MIFFERLDFSGREEFYLWIRVQKIGTHGQ
jgi:hypothetical protein